MSYRDEDDPFDEDIVFDQAGLLSTTRKSAKSAIRRVSSGKCATFSKTMGLCGAFLGLGLVSAIPGPVSPIPPTELKENISLMSPELMFRCTGFMIGSMFGGMLLDRFNRLFLVFLALLFTSVIVTIIPWCGYIWLLRTDMLLLGLTMGFLITGGNVLCLDLWGKNSGPFMQALHFSFSLGVFLAPFLAQPLAGPITQPSIINATLAPVTLSRIPRDVQNLSFMGYAEGGVLNDSLASSSLLLPSASAPVNHKSISTSVVDHPISTASSVSLSSGTPGFQQRNISLNSSHQMKVNVTAVNTSTTVPEKVSTTTHRVPKPKPALTNADKLDHSQDWEKVPIGKPPPEDLVPISTTTLSSKSNSIAHLTTAVPKIESKNSTLNTSAKDSSSTNSAAILSTPTVASNLNTSHATVGTQVSTTTISSQHSALPGLAVLSQIKPEAYDKSTTLKIEGHDFYLKNQPQKSSNASVSKQHENITDVPLSLKPAQSSQPLEQKQQGLASREVTEQIKEKHEVVVGGFENSNRKKIVSLESDHEDIQNTTAVMTPHVSSLHDSAIRTDQNSSVTKSTTGTFKTESIENPSNNGELSTLQHQKHTHHSKPVSVDNDAEDIHTVMDVFANRLGKYGLSKMQLSYLVVGMVLLGTSLTFLGFLCFNPRDPKSKTDEEEMKGHVNRASNGRLSTVRPLPRWLRNTIIGLMMILLFLSSGIQAMYGQLLLAFSIHSSLSLSQSTGIALTLTFWGALTSTRLACILLASALSPTALMVISVAICSGATWLLSALASSSEPALWLGSVLVGIGTATILPSGILWLQRHMLVTHRVAAMLLMGPAMGEMLLPSMTYKMMVAADPASLLHVPALLSLFTIALWAATWRLARLPMQSLCSQGEGSSGYQLANQHDEDDLLDLSMSPVVRNHQVTARNSARSVANGHSFHRLGS